MSGGREYRDALLRVVVDIEATADTDAFFRDFKERLKERFRPEEDCLVIFTYHIQCPGAGLYHADTVSPGTGARIGRRLAAPSARAPYCGPGHGRSLPAGSRGRNFCHSAAGHRASWV